MRNHAQVVFLLYFTGNADGIPGTKRDGQPCFVISFKQHFHLRVIFILKTVWMLLDSLEIGKIVRVAFCDQTGIVVLLGLKLCIHLQLL